MYGRHWAVSINVENFNTKSYRCLTILVDPMCDAIVVIKFEFSIYAARSSPTPDVFIYVLSLCKEYACS